MALDERWIGEWLWANPELEYAAQRVLDGAWTDIRTYDCKDKESAYQDYAGFRNVGWECRLVKISRYQVSGKIVPHIVLKYSPRSLPA